MKDNGEKSGNNSISADEPTCRGPFQKVFAAGVGGWFLGGLGLFGASWGIANPGSLSSAAVWTLSHGWIAFLIGLAVMIAFGSIKKIQAGPAMVAYLVPALVLALVSGICLLIFPDRLLGEELMIYLPVVFLFYVLGLLWLWQGRGPDRSDLSLRAIIPSLVGGMIILAFVAVPVFASDAFRYRDAFGLKLSNSSSESGVLRVEGEIDIRKSGNFQFSAPRYAWDGMMEEGASGEPQVEMGEITWGNMGEPASGSIGRFPMQITWRGKKGTIITNSDLPPDEDYINIEVRSQDEENRVVWSMNALLPPKK
jgi:hypothetical protein